MADAEAIKVAVRVRPLNGRERGRGDTAVVGIGQAGDVQVEIPNDKQPRCFAFDFGYGPDADQQRVHEDLGESLITNVVDGYNSCLFAYGQTGAGKSWSVTGDVRSPQQRGLLPRICEGLFARLGATDGLEESTIVCTYLEIYNEKMRDLLTPSSSTLEVRKHPALGIIVPGLAESVVTGFEGVEKLLELGNSLRTVSSTAMNAESSRSHAVFTLTVKQSLADKRQRQAQLHIVDLAGSERQKKTEARDGLRETPT
ncbi:unnamed protein product [Prorocentrum cordatum]|uniref:Kinesin-like protein n=1 Tax=Prorocentrum cordatum TaxID=2364126 RepID=A0ABN9RLV0_9DINO|nr:unnamed protein product [Polarella glacialis]